MKTPILNNLPDLTFTDTPEVMARDTTDVMVLIPTVKE